MEAHIQDNFSRAGSPLLHVTDGLSWGCSLGADSSTHCTDCWTLLLRKIKNEQPDNCSHRPESSIPSSCNYLFYSNNESWQISSPYMLSSQSSLKLENGKGALCSQAIWALCARSKPACMVEVCPEFVKHDRSFLVICTSPGLTFFSCASQHKTKPLQRWLQTKIKCMILRMVQHCLFWPTSVIAFVFRQSSPT